MGSRSPVRHRCHLSLAITLSLAIFLLSGETCSAFDLVVNEVLANEPDSETSLEWVELLNTSSDSARLVNYFFIDGNDTTRFPAGAVVPPAGFAVLARKATGSASFEAHWGDSSGVWGDDSTESYLLFQVKLSLRNTADTVRLLHVPTARIDAFIWSSSSQDGVSLERANPFKAASGGNVAYCRALAGSTPGRDNSILLPERELGIVFDSVNVGLISPDSGMVEIRLDIGNIGSRSVSDAYLYVISDRDFSGTRTEADDSDSLKLPEILPDSIFRAELTLRDANGRKRLLFALSYDADSTNNTRDYTLSVGHFYPELIVNEFLPNPGDSLACEWIELLCVTPYQLPIGDFSLGDRTRRYSLGSDFVADSGAIIIVCEDSLNFRRYYGNVECPVIEPSSWSRLDNSADAIILVNEFGALSDTVDYDTASETNRSWERDADSTSSEFTHLFYLSNDQTQSTPCRVNSQRTLPVLNDLGFAALLTADFPVTGDPVAQFRFLIRNYAAVTSTTRSLSVYEDADLDSAFSALELLGSVNVPALAAGDSITLSAQFRFEPGHHQIVAMLPVDEDAANNSATLFFSLGAPTREVLITEFLANPEGSLECEWVEIKNTTTHTLDLSGWQFGDSLNLHKIGRPALIAPGEYAIVTDDSACFANFAATECAVIQPNGWSSLNNSGDRIRLVDEFGTLSDSVSYAATASANRAIELNELTAADWYASTDPAGSTPCRVNSVSSPPVSGIALELPKRVFSPSAGELLLLDLRCPPATSLTLEVFDLSGRRQRTIASEQPFSTGQFSYDGASDDWGTLPVGAYLLVVRDKAGAFERKVGFAVAR